MIAKQLERLSAGDNAIDIIIRAALIAFLALLVIGNLDYTDVFPFVEKHK